VRERRGVGTGSGRGVVGPWAVSGFGRKGFPGLFRGWAVFFSSFLLFFSSFLFLFSISFITFANLVQIASNQLCKVYKIPSNNSEQ
jgi:hypothetical protein